MTAVVGLDGVVAAAGVLGVDAELGIAGVTDAPLPAAALVLATGAEAGALVGAGVDVAAVEDCEGEAGVVTGVDSALGVELSPHPIAVRRQRLHAVNVDLFGMDSPRGVTRLMRVLSTCGRFGCSNLEYENRAAQRLSMCSNPKPRGFESASRKPENVA